MRLSNFKSFKITGLFGDRNVNIPFKDDVKILIGENGLGKTTVLNILYYTLTDKFLKLRDFDFKSLEISFRDKEKIVIEKNKLAEVDGESLHYVSPNVIDQLSKSLSRAEIEEIRNFFDQGAPSHYILDRFARRVNSKSAQLLRRFSPRIGAAALKAVCGFGEYNEKIKRAREILEKELKDIEILYFPTFRRIEEDLISLGFDEENLEISPSDARLIQFGMTDVIDRLDEIKNEINNLSSKGLSQISSEILSQLVKGVPEINQNALQNISRNDIDIILARVGDAITQEDKEKITKVVSDQKLKDYDDKYLVYFLQKLINIYDQQREIDNSIENFVSVCNKYLKMSEKEIVYEASDVNFYLKTKSKSKSKSKRILLTDILSRLSSGEKQIISLFSKIYLSKGKTFVVLIDEPELSLSIFWQKLLLPDIVASKKCSFLLSVTHSPFIFENDLEKHAIGLNQYIKMN